jgi:hypothetical protein
MEIIWKGIGEDAYRSRTTYQLNLENTYIGNIRKS